MTENLFVLTDKRAFLTGKTGLLAPIWQETLEGAGCEVMVYGLPEDDVLDKEKLKQIAESFTPDIIVNNAAIDNPPDTQSTFFGNFEAIMAVNLTGAVNVCEAFIPGMLNCGGGVIINIGSIQGFVAADIRNYTPPFEKPLAYNLSKAALIQLARSITVQYGRYGIRCVTIALSAYEGDKWDDEFRARFLKCVPTGKLITKKDLQKTLLYACTCEGFAGYTLLVDGGYTAL